MTPPDPGRVLRWALVAWGLGHLLLGRRTAGWAWLAAELLGVLLVAWLTAGLADSSAYLVPFLAGVAFLVAWAWQAIEAYRLARRGGPTDAPPSGRSPAAAIGWLSLPLLVWGTGFWMVAGRSATPAAVLDRFITQWISGELGTEWSAEVVRVAGRALPDIGEGDFRGRIVDAGTAEADRANVVIERIHFERRNAMVLGLFAGSELVPVSDGPVLTLQLRSAPVELLGGGDIGAVSWQVAHARGSDED